MAEGVRRATATATACFIHPENLPGGCNVIIFPSAFLQEWVCKRCREMNPWVTTHWDLTQLPGTLCWMRVRTGEAWDVANLINLLNEGYKHGLYPNTCVRWNKNKRSHSSDSFLWKSMVTRTLVLVSNSSLNCGARNGLWESKAVLNQSNLPKFQSQENKKKAHFHGARQTIHYKAVTGRVLMLPLLQIPLPIPVNAFQSHIKEFPKHQPTFHTPAGGQQDQHLLIKWCTHT